MKKAALAISVFLLFSAVLVGGVLGAPSRALADGSTVITFSDPGFFQALINAGVDANHDGSITQGEMATPTDLNITGFDVNNLDGISYAMNLTSLTISYTNIAALPSEISSLTQLKTLSLDVNSQMSVSGLPPSLWTMTGLTTLDLDMDNITSIPTGIQSLTGLTELNLYGNNIATLPDYIGNLTSLQRLYLQQNNISVLPSSFCQLTNLKEVTLWSNQLGTLPLNIGSLNALTYLDLAFNSLTALPTSFHNLTALHTLKLNGNLLTELPSGVFAGMAALSTFDISSNYLDPQSGSPDRAEIDAASIHNASNLVQNEYHVSLNYNGGTGSALPKQQYYYGESVMLPTATKAGSVFTGWDVDGDGVTDKNAGETALIAPANLTDVNVAFDAVYGYTVTFKTQRFGTINGGSVDIPSNVNAGEHVSSVPAVSANTGYEFLGWYGGTQKVDAADILGMAIQSSKIFTAEFDAIGTLQFPDANFAAALTTAGVDSNNDGFITSNEMKARTSLDLSGSQFTDITGISAATNLQVLSLKADGFSTLPSEITQLSSLKTLDLGGNPIASLPGSVSNLTNLTELDMDNCTLRVVPGAIAGLNSLVTLNVSSNRLTDLPDFLKSMGSLAHLDISNNYFNPDALPSGTPGFAVKQPQKTYAVSLDCKGGTGATQPGNYYYGQRIDLPAVTKAGFDFYGWDANGDGVADIVGAGSATLTPNPPESITSATYAAVYLSKDAHLSNISLSAGAYMTPSIFDPSVTYYTVTLYDYVNSVTATPIMANASATMLINGSSASSIPLTPTSGDVNISLTAQDTTTTLSYTLHVVQAPHVDLGLTAITLSAGVTLSPKYSAAVTSYTALVPAATGSVLVGVKRASASSKVTISGVACPTFSMPVSVALGATKTVQIVISAPLCTDKTKIYTLILKRGTSLSGFSALPKVGTVFTLSPGGTNRMALGYKMASAGSVKIEVYKGTKWIPIFARAETSAGVKSWAWDGKVSGVYLPVAAYKLRITPTANGIVGAAATISVKIAKFPTVTWGPAVSSLKATGALKPLCSFKVDVPTNVIVQVYNSKGKLVAAVKSFTNLLPSSAFAAITWNGRATKGNTAKLAANALVPAGTYTIKIAAGTKVYAKTIKVTR